MSSKATIHVWGINNKPSLVSPESIAICWILQANEYKSIDIVFSNNTSLSPNEELPVMFDEEGKKYTGIVSIVEQLFPCENLLELALLSFVREEMHRYTEYELYLNADNYNEYTSKIYSYLLYWPFWYNTPLTKRSIARQLCEDIAVDIPNVENSNEENSMMEDASSMAQSKTFKITHDNKNKHLLKLKQLKNHSRFLSKLDTTLNQWFEARKGCNEKIVLPADFLMAAHIKVQTSLPHGDSLRAHFQDKYPEWYLAINSIIDNYQGTPVPNRQPTFSESGNILMSAVNQLKRLF